MDTLGTVEKEHIAFVYAGRSDSGKTHRWEVVAKDGQVTLGAVSFFGRWRKYSFFPRNDTIFEQTCLRDIAQFCEDQTREQRRSQAGCKAAP